MKGERAHNENDCIDCWQQQLEFIGVALGQGIHGPKGEIGRKESREGHAISHQEGGQAKQPEVAMSTMGFMAFVADLGWVHVHVRGTAVAFGEVAIGQIGEACHG